MIDFRYHLVSIVAVFLALAIGIVVGATALKPAALKGLDRASRQEKNEIAALQQDNSELRQQVSGNQQFAQAAAPRLLGHLLDGQSVVLVTVPGSDQQVVSGVTTALRQAGATVAGQVVMQQQFFDTSASTQASLDALARRLAPVGLGLAGGADPSPQVAGQQEAARVIAVALMTRDTAVVTAQQGQAILAGFAQQGFLSVSPASGRPTLASADLAVVVIPATPPASGDSDPANLALISLAGQLNSAGRGALLAGTYPGSGPGSAIHEVTSGNAGIELTTVDNANYEVGQVIVAQALWQLLEGSKPASYGVAPGAVPSPVPTPAATETVPVGASPGTRGGKK